MYGALQYGQIWYGEQSFDLTVPAITLDLTGTAVVISSVTGKDESDFSFTASEPYEAYQIRSVPNGSSDHTAGTLIESGGAGDGTARALDITAAELSGLGEGTYTIKLFVQDLAGNWST